jgi:23S rRNA (uracil-5-)-methyltransferase RumA
LPAQAGITGQCERSICARINSAEPGAGKKQLPVLTVQKRGREEASARINSVEQVGRKKQLPVLRGVRITDIGSEGNAIAKIDDMVLFVPGMIPGDVIDVRVTKKKKRFMEGVALEVITPSPDRINPPCSHFGVCGGCRWQHLPYDRQLHYKEKQVTDNLTRIGHITIPRADPVLGSEKIYGYRNKLEFTFSERRWMTRQEMESAPEDGGMTATGGTLILPTAVPSSGGVAFPGVSPGEQACGGCQGTASGEEEASSGKESPSGIPSSEEPSEGSETFTGSSSGTHLSVSSAGCLSSHSGSAALLRPPAGPAVGFHIPGIFDKVLDIRECLLMSEPSDMIRNEVRTYALSRKLPFYDYREHRGFLRNMIVRKSSTGEVMVVLVTTDALPAERDLLLGFIVKRFHQVTSLYSIINTKRNDSISDLSPVHVAGKRYITEVMDGLRFRVGPKSFYQTNSGQAVRLYGIVKDFAQLTGNENVYDLYTGTGTIACYLASQAARVTGIEYIEEAVADARINAEENGIANTHFIAGDIKDIFNDKLFGGRGKPDVIITDPPRAGMHGDVVTAMLRSGASRIVYVSCNPATQARDIALLSEVYEVERIAPVDMFPHTFHIENVALLRRHPGQ